MLLAPLNLALIVLTGLVILMVKPVWSLADKTPILINNEEVATVLTYSLLDRADFKQVQINPKYENTVIKYLNAETGKARESEIAEKTVGDNPLVKGRDNQWFTLKDEELNCWLFSVYDSTGSAIPTGRLIYKNRWLDKLSMAYADFEGRWQIGYRIEELDNRDFDIEVTGSTVELIFCVNHATRLFHTAIDKVESSALYQEVSDSLSAIVGQAFTNSDIYEVIIAKLRYEWYHTNLKNERGRSFFNGKVLAVTDFDGDGGEDAFVLVSGDRFTSNSLIRYDITAGKVIWEIRCYGTVKEFIAIDLDNDGTQEIILTTYASGSGCSGDWFDLELKLKTNRSYIVVLDRQGRVKEYRGEEAILDTGGFTTQSVIHPLPSGKLLAAPTSSNDKVGKSLLLVDFVNNQVDTLSISYHEALFFKQEGEELNFYCRQDGFITKVVFDGDLAVQEIIRGEVENINNSKAEWGINFQGKSYQVFSPLEIFDENLDSVYKLDQCTFRNLQGSGNVYYYAKSIPGIYQHKLMKLTLRENRQVNRFYLIIWLSIILILTIYIFMQIVFSLPQEAVSGSYAVLYKFLGIFYNWRIFGKTSIYTQPVIVSLSSHRFYDTIKDLCENYQQLSERNLGLMQLYVYKLGIDNEMHIVQRIAHDIKNQVHLLNMLIASVEDNLAGLSADQRYSYDCTAEGLKELYSKISMLSNFSRINLMNREECDLVSLIDGLVIRYNSHPRFNDLYWEPEIDQVLVYGDQNLLSTALLNVLENSLRYSPVGTPVEIILKVESDQAVLCFKNQRQIKSGALELKLEGVENLPGSGIGIIIAEKVILNHDGEMNISFDNGDAVVIIRLNCL